jgi:hypothetical protein
MLEITHTMQYRIGSDHPLPYIGIWDKAVPVLAIKAYGEMEVQLHSFLLSALLEWRDQFPTPPTTPGEGAPGTHWRGAEWAPELVRMFWRRKIFCSIGINSLFLSCPACTLLTILSMLFHYTDVLYVCSSYLSH